MQTEVERAPDDPIKAAYWRGFADGRKNIMAHNSKRRKGFRPSVLVWAFGVCLAFWVAVILIISRMF